MYVNIYFLWRNPAQEKKVNLKASAQGWSSLSPELSGQDVIRLHTHKSDTPRERWQTHPEEAKPRSVWPVWQRGHSRRGEGTMTKGLGLMNIQSQQDFSGRTMGRGRQGSPWEAKQVA